MRDDQPKRSASRKQAIESRDGSGTVEDDERVALSGCEHGRLDAVDLDVLLAVVGISAHSRRRQRPSVDGDRAVAFGADPRDDLVREHGHVLDRHPLGHVRVLEHDVERLQPASSAHWTIVSATVSGDPHAMRPIATMSSQEASVP